MDVKVDGVSCKIKESTLTEIQCRLEPKIAHPSSILSSNQATQSNPYISGSGFQYKRYSISQASSKSAKGIKATMDSGDLSKLALLDEYISG